MTDTNRPSNTEDEIDRTGRDAEVTGRDIKAGADKAGADKAGTTFGTPGTPADQVSEEHDNDFA